jgi:hypothetical protein
VRAELLFGLACLNLVLIGVMGESRLSFALGSAGGFVGVSAPDVEVLGAIVWYWNSHVSWDICRTFVSAVTGAKGVGVRETRNSLVSIA